MTAHNHPSQELDTFPQLPPRPPAMCPWCQQAEYETDLWRTNAEEWRTYAIDQRDDVKTWQASAWILAAAFVAVTVLSIFN